MDGQFFGMRSQIFPSLPIVPEDVPGEREKLAKICLREMRESVPTLANVKEMPSAYEFVVDMPGVKSGDIKVQVEDGKKLTIVGERRRDEDDKEGGKYHCSERRMGKFMRKFSLPDNANLENITAVYRHGILTATVQKLPEAESKYPKTIEIKID
ncbi:17.3 kDa class II heat shock protein-like [Dendrobium catenatum]|uniref:17.9 kDa class II heat shock protein n=1 Tax=Dendrobium catenatum TaxID=906689 RepID=A0A2I0VE48_9ASPA|nr:17.3 kDa class II heat shock protein-like [Dendrobium catenatum]PKU61671.1 17.9 kDa class II heat shock protein [Dendrobium catenatum]